MCVVYLVQDINSCCFAQGVAAGGANSSEVPRASFQTRWWQDSSNNTPRTMNHVTEREGLAGAGALPRPPVAVDLNGEVEFCKDLQEFQAVKLLDPIHDLVRYFSFFESQLTTRGYPESTWALHLRAQAKSHRSRQFLDSALKPLEEKGLKGYALYCAARDELLGREPSRYGPGAYFEALVDMVTSPQRLAFDYRSVYQEVDSWMDHYEEARKRDRAKQPDGRCEWPSVGTKAFLRFLYITCRTPRERRSEVFESLQPPSGGSPPIWTRFATLAREKDDITALQKVSSFAFPQFVSGGADSYTAYHKRTEELRADLEGQNRSFSSQQRRRDSAFRMAETPDRSKRGQGGRASLCSERASLASSSGHLRGGERHRREGRRRRRDYSSHPEKPSYRRRRNQTRGRGA